MKDEGTFVTISLISIGNGRRMKLDSHIPRSGVTPPSTVFLLFLLCTESHRPNVFRQSTDLFWSLIISTPIFQMN